MMMLKENKYRKLFMKVAFILSAMLIHFSCSKTSGGSSGDDSNHIPLDINDATLPVIVIDKPIANQVFVNGDNIIIQGKVTDNSLYRGTIKIINDLNNAKVYSNPIVTSIEPLTQFYKAKDAHQNYYANNKNQGYCQMVIQPKIEKFEKIFKDRLKNKK